MVVGCVVVGCVVVGCVVVGCVMVGCVVVGCVMVGCVVVPGRLRGGRFRDGQFCDARLCAQFCGRLWCASLRWGVLGPPVCLCIFAVLSCASLCMSLKVALFSGLSVCICDLCRIGDVVHKALKHAFDPAILRLSVDHR